jgi:hypothetical protein
MNDNKEKEGKEISFKKKNNMPTYIISFPMDNTDNVDITTTLSNNIIYSYTLRNLQILIKYFYKQKLLIKKIKEQNKEKSEVTYIMDKKYI